MNQTVIQDAFLEALRDSLPAAALIEQQVRAALAEDLGGGDRTAALLPADRKSRVELITRQNAVVCGQAWFDEVFCPVSYTHLTLPTIYSV